MPGSTTVGQNSGGMVWPHSLISQDGNRRVEPSRNIDVPVRLRAGGHLRRVVRAEQPDRVDLGQAAERGADARRR